MSEEPVPAEPPTEDAVTADAATPPPPHEPTFWGSILVVWGTKYAMAALGMLVLSYAWPAGTHLYPLFGPPSFSYLLQVSSARGLATALLRLLPLALVPLGLTALWKRRTQPAVPLAGVLIALALAAEFAQRSLPSLQFFRWLFLLGAGSTLAWGARRELPRSSRPFVVLLAAAVVFGRSSTMLLATLVQIGWVFLSSRRPLVRRRDTHRRYKPRRGARQRLELLAVVLVAFVYPVTRSLLIPAGGRAVSTPQSIIGGIAWEVGVALLVFALLLRDSRFRADLPRSRRGWWYELGFGVWLCLLLGALHSVVTSLTALVPSWPNAWDRVDYTLAMRVTLAVESLFSAFYEEIVFRAFLITRLRPILKGANAAILVSATMFALMHGYSPHGTVWVFVFGLVMGLVYVRTGSLARLVIAHWLTNAISFLWIN